MEIHILDLQNTTNVVIITKNADIITSIHPIRNKYTYSSIIYLYNVKKKVYKIIQYYIFPFSPMYICIEINSLSHFTPKGSSSPFAGELEGANCR